LLFLADSVLDLLKNHLTPTQSFQIHNINFQLLLRFTYVAFFLLYLNPFIQMDNKRFITEKLLKVL
jgi:hypothetical protein